MESTQTVKRIIHRSFDMNGRASLSKRLQGKLVLWLTLICLFGCITFLLALSPFWMGAIWTAIITIGIFIYTTRLVDSSERKLTAFLQALRQNDFAVTFPEDSHGENFDLHSAFNELNTIYKKLRSERESHHQLLQIVLEHANTPLICFDESSSEIHLINNAAKQLLQVPFLQKITAVSRLDVELLNLFVDIRDGEKRSHKLSISGKPIFITVNSTHILFEKRTLKLIAIQDVTSELAAKEAETWQKLLRVLTHEISNSAIPLSTLSSYIYDMVIQSREEKRELTEEQRSDIMTSLKTIDQRSRTLKEFVQNFRLVGQVPEPTLTRTSAHDVITDAINLFAKDFGNERIIVAMDVPADVMIYADGNLTQQVFINLFKNAIEAMANMKEHKKIGIHARMEGHRYVHIVIADSGAGIAPEDMDQIFIPFFSTKKGGNGIGLSISRQIMQKQKGDITVASTPGKGTEFLLSFLVASSS